MKTATWTGNRCRESLFAQHQQLLRELPNVIETSRTLDDAQRADALMDAILVACDYADDPDRPDIESADQLRRVLWSCCRRTVAHQLDGRHDTVRAGFTAASVDDQDLVNVISAEPSPDEALILDQDLKLAHEVAAGLDGELAQAFKVMYSGRRVLGERRLATRLGVSRARARQLERQVFAHLEAFSELTLSQQLCRTRKTQIGDTLAGRADASVVRTVKAHVAHCPSCRHDLATLKRHIHDVKFGRKVAGLLPLPATAGNDRLGRIRDWGLDLFGRHGESAAAATTQLTASGAGRLGGQLAACVSGIAAAVLCAGALVAGPLGPDKRDARPEAAVSPTPTAAATISGPIATREPDPIVTATPTQTPTPNRKKRSGSSSRTASAKTQGGTGPSDVENSVASDVPSGSLPSGQSEFEPSGATGSAPPAPAPAAPGSSEFAP